MTARNGLKQGEHVGPHFKAPLPTSKDILADQVFLTEVFQLRDLSVSLALQRDYARFSDERSAKVSRKLMRRTPELIHEKGKNKYQPETRRLFRDYAAKGYIGIAADPAYGNDPEHRGMGLPKALLPGIAMLGFNANPSFYLKEMVTQGALKLLQAAVDHEETQGNQPKVKMLNNVFSKITRGEYTGAMLLTEPQTGSNLGGDMETYATIPDGSDKVSLEGKKKYITGLTTGGIGMVENAIGIVVSATKDQDGNVLVTKDGKTAASVSLIPLYKLDENGETTRPLQQNDFTTSHWIRKDGIKQQILQMHDFQGAEGILLGKRGKGWDMMFNVMDVARMEIGAQAVAHIHTAFHLASDYVTKRGTDTASGESYAKFAQVRLKLNLMRAFSQTAAAVLMSAGQHIDMAHGKHGSEIERAEAKALHTMEPSMLKAYMTRHAGIIANDAGAVLAGCDGYISRPNHPVSPMTQLLADLRPTKFYEGTNAMMDKQIVFQQFFTDKTKTECRMDVFTQQTNRMLDEWETSSGNADVRSMIKRVRTATAELSAAIVWLKGEHTKMRGVLDAQEAEGKMQAASEMYTELYGRVFMGREAVHIASYAARQLDNENTPQEKRELEHRLLLADMAVHEFVDKGRPSLDIMQQEHRFAALGPDTEERVETAVASQKPARDRALKGRQKTRQLAA